MKWLKTHWSLVFIAALILNGASAARGADDTNKWVSLFNGKDLSGWVNVHNVTCEAKDGNLHLVKGMGWLRTEKEYGDFVLEWECRGLVDKFDSGVFFRSVLEGKPWPKDGWQANIRFDSYGGLVRGYTPVKTADADSVPVNKWAKFRLEVRGKNAKLDINGERAWDHDAIMPAKGYLGIQVEDRELDFKNIRVMTLD